MLTPSMFAKKMDSFWSRDNEFGSFTVTITGDGHATAEMKDAECVPHIAIMAIGYVTTALEAITGGPVEMTCAEWSESNPTPNPATYEIRWKA